MKFKAILMTTFVGLAFLAGCSGSDTGVKNEPATTTTVMRATTTTSTYSLLDKYVSAVKTRLPNATRAQAIDLGQQACTTIRAYGSIELAVYGIASDPTWTPDMAKMAGFVMGAAIPVFCPEYAAELQKIN